MTTTSLTAFERATAVRPTDEGRFAADVSPDWSAPTGPNGGYIAAIAVRAITAAVDPGGERRLRSLTCQYLRSPAVGRLELEVRTVRSGRRVSFVAVTGWQDGREVLTGLAVLAVPDLPAAGTWSPTMPAAADPPAADAPAVPGPDYRPGGGSWVQTPEGTPAIVQQLRIAPQFGGAPFSGRAPDPGQPVEAGGWMASAEAQPIDAAFVAQLTDFWWPPAFVALSGPAAAPTLDLTIHVRADLPPGGLAPSPVLGHFRSTAAQGGLMEEDGQLFLPDGTLLAQSRQLALLTPVAP